MILTARDSNEFKKTLERYRASPFISAQVVRSDLQFKKPRDEVLPHPSSLFRFSSAKEPQSNTALSPGRTPLQSSHILVSTRNVIFPSKYARTRQPLTPHGLAALIYASTTYSLNDYKEPSCKNLPRAFSSARFTCTSSTLCD